MYIHVLCYSCEYILFSLQVSLKRVVNCNTSNTVMTTSSTMLSLHVTHILYSYVKMDNASINGEMNSDGFIAVVSSTVCTFMHDISAWP